MESSNYCALHRYLKKQRFFYMESAAIIAQELLLTYGADDNVLKTFLAPMETKMMGELKLEIKTLAAHLNQAEQALSQQRQAT